MKKSGKKAPETPSTSPQSTPPKETPAEKKKREEAEKKRKKEESDRKKKEEEAQKRKKKEEADKKKKEEADKKKKEDAERKKMEKSRRTASPPPVTHTDKKRGDALAKKKSSDKKVSELQQLEERRGSLALAQLAKDEEQFFEKIQAGIVGDVEKFLADHKNLNLNSINFCGVSALHVAIENKNLPLVKMLFRRQDLYIRDAALLAVATGDPEFATAVLDLIKNISPELETRGCDDSTDYSPDITPLALAAQNGDYKMVRMLLERGHELEKPHVPDCLCPTCKTLLRESGSSTSRIRLNAYQAAANPAYICQVTDDPILYCFVVDKEMSACALMDKEFRVEYSELAQEVRNFTVELLSKCRNMTEVELLLKLPWGPDDAMIGSPAANSRAMKRARLILDRAEFPRVQLALDYRQKEFVAHSLVQQVLTAYWLGDFRSWPRLSLFYKMLHCFVRMVTLPVICLGLIIVPWIRPLKKHKSPLNRFLLHLVSYLFFLMTIFLLNYLDTGSYHKGAPKTGVEAIVIIFVLGHIWATIRQMWVDGIRRFIQLPWNWYDLLTELVFVLTFVFWFKSHLDVLADHEHKRVPLARKFWKSDDATLLHEGFFAVGSVLAFGKLGHYCLQSSRLGPLQVSMGKMLLQIAYFLLLCLLINTAFANALTRMYAYYNGMKQTDKDGNQRTQLSTFSSFGNSFLTLFWGMFGMSPAESADVVVENLSDDLKDPVLNSHDFTEGVGRALFATYELIMIIALVNTLIAILSNTFQKVVDNADVEFKFHRAKLWTSFFHDSKLLPPPFNLIPTSNFFTACTTYARALAKNIPGAEAKFSMRRCCYVEYEKEKEVDIAEYEALMSSLVQRYFRSKEQEEEEE